MKNSISICYTEPFLKDKAEKLSHRLSLPLQVEASYQLIISENGLGIGKKGIKPVYANFSSSNCKAFLNEGKKHALIQACKPKKGLSILDVTAGWGRDALHLACFGAKVMMLERDPIMAEILTDGLMRMNDIDRLKINLNLINIDSKLYLDSLNEHDYPDIIYMDPMHPARKKKALVKKDMQLLQCLIGPDIDALGLLHIAREKARNKVVVKWPVNSAPLIEPDSSIKGKTVRFDIFNN